MVLLNYHRREVFDASHVRFFCHETARLGRRGYGALAGAGPARPLRRLLTQRSLQRTRKVVRRQTVEPLVIGAIILREVVPLSPERGAHSQLTQAVQRCRHVVALQLLEEECLWARVRRKLLKLLWRHL